MKTRFTKRSTADDVLQGIDLAGKVVLLTGCNSGLGFETMRVMVRHGAHVIAAARTLKAAQEACTMAGGRTTPIACDLSDFASIGGCIDTINSGGVQLDGVIANAGIMMLPHLQQAHGLEKQFVVNYLGHFMLINGILGAIKQHCGARIVIVASGAHKRAPRTGVDLANLTGERGYNRVRAYGQSNVARILFARALSRRLAGAGIAVNALRPGTVVGTGLFRHANPWLRIALRPLSKTVPQGAATQCYVAAHPDAACISGAYFSNCGIAEPSPAAMDDGLGERVWAASEKLLAPYRPAAVAG